MSNFEGYMIFRPRLTKYCSACVPGVPGGVDAPAQETSCVSIDVNVNFESLSNRLQDAVANKYEYIIVHQKPGWAG